MRILRGNAASAMFSKTSLTFLCLLLTRCAGSDSIAERGVLLASPGVSSHVSEPSPSAGKPQAPSFELLAQPPTRPVAASVERRLPVTSDSTHVSLDYTNADIRQVVNDVIGDIMSIPVIIDPDVAGKMTLRTSEVPASDVPRLLDQALAPYGYGLAMVDRGVRVGRLVDLAGGTRSDVQVIPVRYVDPAEVIKVIRPNVEESVRLTPAPGQQGIAVSGPPSSVDSVRELIGLLDTDAMAHKRFALYTLAQASPAAVERELSFLFSQNDQGRVRVRLAALERLNGILVVADDPAVLQQVRRVIARLDKPSEAAANIHVRPLRYRRATEAAQVLARVFGAQPPSVVSRAQPAGEFGKLSIGGSASDRSSLPLTVPGLSDERSDAAASTTQTKDDALVSAVSLGLSAPVRIQADPSQNALVIFATPHDNKIIEAAVRRLDVKPRQVLIQVIVAEVRLNDHLRYGVDYLLSSMDFGAVSQGGLSYVFPNRDVNIVLRALNGVGDVKVVSAPRILTVDNQTATIEVGDQVPVLARSSQSTLSQNSSIVSDIQLRDTGVILAVTPRIGPGGSVTLDIFQEVSTANKNTLTNVQSPVISVRRLQSTVSTRNGDTIAIGGLMQDSINRMDSGAPVLKDIPLLGSLFASTEHAKDRTELLVLLNPRVVESGADAQGLTEELRAKFESLAPDLGRHLTPQRKRRSQATDSGVWAQ